MSRNVIICYIAVLLKFTKEIWDQ